MFRDLRNDRTALALLIVLAGLILLMLLLAAGVWKGSANKAEDRETVNIYRSALILDKDRWTECSCGAVPISSGGAVPVTSREDYYEVMMSVYVNRHELTVTWPTNADVYRALVPGERYDLVVRGVEWPYVSGFAP